MTVTVRLFATFRDFLPAHATQAGLSVDVQAHATVQALMQAVGVPENLAKIVLVNGQHAAADHVLSDGDIVSVAPPLIGG